jgi:hypothetical protein
LADDFARSLDCYRQRRLDEALERFEALLQRFPDDGPSQFYIDHIRRLLADPVAANADDAVLVLS